MSDHSFSTMPDPLAQASRGNALSNLIQDSKALNTANFIQKYSQTPSSYLNKYLTEPETHQSRSKGLSQQQNQPSKLSKKNNNEKDPRIKSEFYQEKPNSAQNGVPQSIEIEEERGSQNDIFKRDFIPFDSKTNRTSDIQREMQDLEEINGNSKRIKKLKTTNNQPRNQYSEFPQDRQYSTYQNQSQNQNMNYSNQSPSYSKQNQPYSNQTQQSSNNQQYSNPPYGNQPQYYFNDRPQIDHHYCESKTDSFFGAPVTELIHPSQKNLPIFPRCNVILDSIEREQVVVISGDTGCGKSTQVPKYIYLNGLSKGRRVKIVCTQPRRMAALNLAKRVAYELKARLGGVVGYQISLDSRQQDSTAILYVTNGIFLQSLIHDKNIFDEVTHVILDEIHERDIDSDFTMIAMKHLLKENPKVKLILMSATINTQLFVNYFSRDEIQNCHKKEYNYELTANSKKWEKLSNWDDFDPKIALLNNPREEEEFPSWQNSQFNVKKEKDVNPWGSSRKIEAGKDGAVEQYKINMSDTPAYHVEIPPPQGAKSYKVETFYIDSVERFLGKPIINNGIEFRYIDFDKRKPTLHNECVQLAIEIIRNILIREDNEKQKLARENRKLPKDFDGSVLVFLPGLNEITSFVSKIEESLQEPHLKQLWMIPLHSALPDSQNEQIFAAKEAGRRKVIVSTNIAESSITVPDIVYVIDFCLSKETNYNPYNSIEKLELCWESRASAVQRAGRTGRVCNGSCFRLIPEAFFFHQLLAFTTPELLRSPLDKLILRIKTINEDDPKNIFDDPQKVLGRAIQPPHIDNISFALKSLQDAGALTWSTDKSYKSCKITQLGKIYCDLPCDIRICKLCIMGFIFNCLQESLTIASILQHQKTMFVMNSRINPRDQSKFYKNISNYDRGVNSDLILMLNLFNDWEERFGRCEEEKMKLKNESQNNFGFTPKDNNAKNLKRVYRKQQVSEIERKYCKDNFLDPIVLREILIQREDIKQRLCKFNFQENHYKSSNKDSQVTFLKLKILFAACFNNNFLRAYQKWDVKLEKKLHNLKTVYNVNTKCALIVTYSGFNAENLTPQQLVSKENEWKDFFSMYGVVEKIKFNYNEAYITFKENGSEEAIKYLLYKKAITNTLKPISVKEENRIEKKPIFDSKEAFKKRHGNNSFEEQEKLFLESMGAFDYLHLCQFNDLLRSHPVQMDNDSINKFVFSNSPFIPNTSSFPFTNPFNKQETILPEQRQEPRILICFDYQERNNNKHYTRYTTLLPDYPLLAPLILLIFSALPQIKVSVDKGRYEKVVLDEHEITLDYFLTEKDIDDINNLRVYLRDNLTGENLSKVPTESFWNLLMELLTRERVKYYEPEVWEDAFKHQTKNSMILDNFMNQNNSKKDFQVISVNKFRKPQGQQSGNPGNPGNENKKIVDFQIYLPNIEKTPLEYHSTFDISREEGKLMYKMYQESYNQWKINVLEEINMHKKFLELKQTYLACGKCKMQISDIKNLKDMDQELFFLRKFLPNPYDVSTLNFNEDDEFLKSEQYFEVETVFGKELEFFGCRNDHIFGIRPKNIDPNDWFIYITEHSNLIVLYPDLTEEAFDFFKFDMKRTLENENAKFRKKKQIIIDKRYDCNICQEFRMAANEFMSHIKEGKKHKETLKEFQASLKKSVI